MHARRRCLFERAATIALALLVAGCAALRIGERTPPREGPELARCEQLYATADAAVARAGVADAQDARIEGFPYLRINRLLAAFARDDLPEEAFLFWVERLAAQDQVARAYELANLGEPATVEFAAEEL
jgi:hypothetical protein